MSERLAKIIAISDKANHTNEVEIWTKCFKVTGKLYKDKDRAIEGVVTLQDAKICQHFGECECKTETITHEWLNIFEDKIIAFTAIKK